MTSRGRFPAWVRHAIIERAAGMCEVCRTANGEQIHHRCARGMGGSRAVWLTSPANGLLLCGTNASGCHGAATETEVAECRQRGIVVPRGLAEQMGGCSTIPFTDAFGETWMLDDDGGKRLITPGRI